MLILAPDLQTPGRQGLRTAIDNPFFEAEVARTEELLYAA